MPDDSRDSIVDADYVAMLRARLQALLAVVDLEVDGEPVRVTGFRLRERDQGET